MPVLAHQISRHFLRTHEFTFRPSCGQCPEHCLCIQLTKVQLSTCCSCWLLWPMSVGIQSVSFLHGIRSKIKEEWIWQRKRRLCVCLSYLDLFVFLSQFKALISAGLISRLFSLPSPLFLLACKVSMFSLLVCLDLWSGWGTQRCSRIKSPKAVIDICIGVSVCIWIHF